MSTSRGFWLRLPLVLIYGVLFTEVFFRTFSPQVLTPRYVVDAGYGIRGNWPGIKYSHYGVEFGRIDFSINSRGVRSDREIPYEKPTNTLRIVAFGDSFTMGYEASQHQTFLSVLEQESNKKSTCNIEVVNLGVSGHGTAEELIALQHEGVKYEPDIVLLQWHSTDLKDNVRSKLFEVKESNVERKNLEYLPMVDIRKDLFENPAYRFIASNSMAFSWLRTKLSRLTKKSQLLDDDEAEGWNVFTRKQTNRTVTAEEQLATALLRAFAETAKTVNSELIILDIPDRVEQDIFQSTFPTKTDLDEVVYSPIVDFLKQGAEQAFWKRKASHLTPIGNRIVGEQLAKRIEKYLENRCTDFQSLGEVVY